MTWVMVFLYLLAGASENGLATIRSLAYDKSFEPTARLRLAAARLHR